MLAGGASGFEVGQERGPVRQGVHLWIARSKVARPTDSGTTSTPPLSRMISSARSSREPDGGLPDPTRRRVNDHNGPGLDAPQRPQRRRRRRPVEHHAER
ncbi:hypothetical protein OHR68_37345 [Spirillospora sp. NBC_00431]